MFNYLAILLLTLIASGVFAQEEAKIDFEAPFKATVKPYLNTWAYGDDNKTYTAIVRGDDNTGIVGQYFRLSDEQWLLLSYLPEGQPQSGIYQSLATKTLQKVRDWPQEQDQVQPEPAFVFPGAPQDSLSRYYVDGTLAAVVYYSEKKQPESYQRSDFIHRDGHFMLPHLQFIKTEEGFYSLTLSDFLHSISQGSYVPTPVVGQPNIDGLLPHGFWEGLHSLDKTWLDKAPNYGIAKGSFVNGRRQGWTLLHTGEGEKTWLSYFEKHEPIASFEGTFDSFTDEAGQEYQPHSIVKVERSYDNFGAQPTDTSDTEIVEYDYDKALLGYLQGEWVLGLQQIPTDFGYPKENWLLWKENSPLHTALKDEAQATLQLQADGKLSYQELQGKKRQRLGKWELQALPLAKDVDWYDGMFGPLSLTLFWEDGGSQSYILDRLFQNLALMEKEAATK